MHFMISFLRQTQCWKSKIIHKYSSSDGEHLKSGELFLYPLNITGSLFVFACIYRKVVPALECMYREAFFVFAYII